jgi:23S rRNA pseudouridine2457 synthase
MSILKHRHFVIHKPYGFLSQFVYNVTTRKNRKLLGELYEFPDGIMAIGRLDQDSEGLMFLTTDGKESFNVRSGAVEKEYYVQLDGLISPEGISKLKNGIEISTDKGKYMTKPCNAFVIDPQPIFPERSKRVRDDRHGPTQWVSITISEGKFRQVRKMTAASGFPTLRLVRVRIGDVWLDDLTSGGVREVEQFDY